MWHDLHSWAKIARQGTLSLNLTALPPGQNKSPVKKRKPTPAKAKRAKLKPLSPSAPAARDEGPRLIPLTPGKDQTGLEHFLRLADVALGRKKRDRDRLP